MESFDNVTSLEEMYSLDSGQEKEIKVEEETENIQDITDDALETMLMEDQSQNATGNPQIQTAVCQSATQQQSVYKVPDSKVVLATQPLQVFTQQRVGNPVVTRFVMKKNPAGNSPATIVSQQQPQPQQPQSFGNFVVNSNVSGVQTLTVQGNNFTFASPGKGNFKIPISPAKNSLKVSMVSPSSGIVSNSVKTINLNSSLGATASPQLQSKFQFQTLMPNHPANVGTNSQQRIQTTVNPQQQVFKIVPAGNERTHQGLTNILPAQSGSQFAIAAVNNQPKLQQFVNVQPVQRIVQQPQAKTQRLIMPATNVMPQPQTSIVNLSPGTILQAGNVGYAMVSAKYVEQLKKQFSNQIYNNDSNKVATSEQPTQSFPKSSVQVNGKVRKPCNCTKSMCLKLYCECFTNGHFCDGCNCINCHNNLEFDAERSKAIKQCLDRNPLAFKPKIGRGGDSSRTHQKGCNCKRSGCLKNYCECYEARIPCTSKCKCIGCKNLEEDGSSQGEPLSLMHLADAAAVRCQQQAAARVKISSHIGEIRSSHHRPHTAPSGERLPSTFFTQEVIEATCTCLLAQAEEAEKTNRSLPVAEMMILEEFGRCMMQIIQAAGKAKSNS